MKGVGEMEEVGSEVKGVGEVGNEGVGEMEEVGSEVKGGGGDGRGGQRGEGPSISNPLSS